MSAFEVDPREHRLPVWAQNKLNDLRRRVNEECRRAEEARLATDPDGSSALLDYYDDLPIGLGADAHVRFVVQPDNPRTIGFIDCYVVGGILRVHGAYDMVAVEPVAANAFNVRPVR